MLAVDIEKRLGDFEIKVAFESKGSVTALFGSSGSGKTSIVNMVAGLVKPDRGRIALDDTVLFDSAARVNVPMHRRRIGYVFQEGRLFPHLSVAANLDYGRRMSRLPRDDAEQRRIVDLLDIGHLLDRRPGKLSGGERQRVAVGRALLMRPRLLLLDEPLASLDAARKREILPYLVRLRDEAHVPMVYVSHQAGELRRIATDGGPARRRARDGNRRAGAARSRRSRRAVSMIPKSGTGFRKDHAQTQHGLHWRMFPPERIVCLTEETVETLYLLGEERRIVGVSGYAVRPARVRKEKPRVSAFISADYEKILALEPDLVLAFSDLQADLVAELIRRNVAVHAFNQRDVAGILDMIRTVGALTGVQLKADALAASLAERLRKVHERAQASLPRHPRVYFEEWDDPMISGIKWVSELIETAGGIEVFPGARGAQERQGPHRLAARRDRRGARHHRRLLVRQEIRAGEGLRARRLRRHPGGALGLAARDQIAADPAARPGRAHRRARRARSDVCGMGGAESVAGKSADDLVPTRGHERVAAHVRRRNASVPAAAAGPADFLSRP